MDWSTQLGDVLIDMGYVTREQLDEALAEQKKTGKLLGQVLIAKGFLSEGRLVEALAAQQQLPVLSLSRYRPMPEAVRLVHFLGLCKKFGELGDGSESVMQSGLGRF